MTKTMPSIICPGSLSSSPTTGKHDKVYGCKDDDEKDDNGKDDDNKDDANKDLKP